MRRTLILALGLASCGYHVSGKADLLPKTVHTIAIPAFQNATIQYKLTDLMPGALAREFITRTRYRVIPDPQDERKVYITTFGGGVWHGSLTSEDVPLDIATPELQPGN